MPKIAIRTSPWVSAETKMTAPRGAREDAMEYQDGWFLVPFGQTDGWVPESSVTNAALIPASATPEAIPPETEASQ